MHTLKAKYMPNHQLYSKTVGGRGGKQEQEERNRLPRGMVPEEQSGIYKS